MRGRHHRRRLDDAAFESMLASGRTFVVRRTALGFRVLIRHPYGRVTRLGPAWRDGRADFASTEQVARAIARDALRRPPRREEVSQVATLLGGRSARWELHEADVRAAAARATQTSRTGRAAA